MGGEINKGYILEGRISTVHKGNQRDGQGSQRPPYAIDWHDIDGEDLESVLRVAETSDVQENIEKALRNGRVFSHHHFEHSENGEVTYYMLYFNRLSEPMSLILLNINKGRQYTGSVEVKAVD